VITATGEDTKFIYDGLDVVVDDDLVVGVTKYQNGLGIDDKLKLTNGGVSTYFLADHLGSTVALTDATGAVTEQNSYDSFGNQTTAGFSSRYQYTGREYDPLSGFYYYRARWYDANVGRFVSEDPIGFVGGDVNIYAYVKNNPAAFRDPSGLSRCNPLLGALVGGAAGAVVGAGTSALAGAAAGEVAGALAGTFALPGGGTVGGGALGGGGGATAGAVAGGVVGAGLGAYVGYQYCSQPDATTSCQPAPRIQPQPNPTPAPLPVPQPT
jgi:RHS repeat-associated protein